MRTGLKHFSRLDFTEEESLDGKVQETHRRKTGLMKERERERERERESKRWRRRVIMVPRKFVWEA